MGIFDKALSFTTKVALRSGEILIEKELQKQLKKSIIISIINFCVLFIALIIVMKEPFGTHISLLVSAILFWGLLLFAVVRFIIFIITYRKLIIFSWRKKSLKKGIADFIKFRYPVLEKAENIMTLGSVFIKDLKETPTVESAVERYISFFFKRIIIFAFFLMIYFLTINFIIRPFMFKTFANITTLELYLYPFMILFGQ